MSARRKNKSKKRQSQKRSKVNTKCPQCGSGHEYYRMLYNLYKFDVDLARDIVSDGRERFEMAPDDVSYALSWARIHEPHLDHINLDYPGIVAYYWYPDPSGEILRGQVLVDGHHRAAKSQRLEKPFFVQILTEEESKRITMRAPNSEKILERVQDKRQSCCVASK